MAIYRDAELIELHDTGVVINHSGLSGAVIGWQEYPGAHGEKFTIKGDDLALMAQIFGIVPPKFVEYEDAKGQQLSMKPDSVVVGIERQRSVIGHAHREDKKISRIEAKIRGEKLLDIKTTSVVPSDNGPKEITNEITYSGGFSVWWTS